MKFTIGQSVYFVSVDKFNVPKINKAEVFGAELDKDKSVIRYKVSKDKDVWITEKGLYLSKQDLINAVSRTLPE